MDAPARCGECGGLNPSSSRRCAHCARRIDLHRRRAVDTPIRCPTCAAECEFASLAGIQVDVCPRCQGMWFDDGELAQLPEKLTSVEQAQAAADCLATLSWSCADNERPAYLPCPICQRPMRRHNYRQASGILVDRCDGCGTWVDRTSALRIFDLITSPYLADVDRRAGQPLAPAAPLCVRQADEPVVFSSHQQVAAAVAETLLRLLLYWDW